MWKYGGKTVDEEVKWRNKSKLKHPKTTMQNDIFLNTVTCRSTERGYISWYKDHTLFTIIFAADTFHMLFLNVFFLPVSLRTTVLDLICDQCR